LLIALTALGDSVGPPPIDSNGTIWALGQTTAPTAPPNEYPLRKTIAPNYSTT